MRHPYEQERELRSVFTSTTGGVMTDEAGAVTGELQAATSINSGALEVSVRYCEAEEWYTVAGSPAQTRGLSETSHEALHQEVLQALTSAGPVGEINEQPVDLSRLTRQF